jgi:hypothetical protein
VKYAVITTQRLRAKSLERKAPAVIFLSLGSLGRSDRPDSLFLFSQQAVDFIYQGAELLGILFLGRLFT